MRLGDVLSSDLRSASLVKKVVDSLRAAMSGSAEQEESVGNGYAIIPGPRVTRVEGLYGETPLRLEVPSEDLLELLERWGVQVSRHNLAD